MSAASSSACSAAHGLAEAAMGRFYTVSFRKNCVLERC
jgi:hypothetical protein